MARRISQLIRFNQVKNELMKQVDAMRRSRLEHGYLFSATHLTSFFQTAAADVASNFNQPFDFVLASRCGNRIQPDHGNHLLTFLRLGAASDVCDKDVNEFVASTLLLDAYPPGMHRRASRSYVSCLS